MSKKAVAASKGKCSNYAEDGISFFNLISIVRVIFLCNVYLLLIYREYSNCGFPGNCLIMLPRSANYINILT